MSNVVCQNLTETTTTTTTIKLKLSAPPPGHYEKLPAEFDRSTNQEFRNRGFDFFQTSTTPKETGHHYTWPKTSSFFSLSAKSLELCTENLGSESGCSDAGSDEDAIFSTPPPLSIPSSNSTPHEGRAGTDNDTNWKHITRFPKYPDHKFPPPLTSSLQVRRRSEGGRLIIEAVEAPHRNSYMQAERTEGRLRIRFVTAEATTAAAAGEEEVEAAAEEEEEGESELEEEVGFDGDVEKSVEVEVGSEKYEWASRCKEEGGDRNQWKPAAVWVAIS